MLFLMIKIIRVMLTADQTKQKNVIEMKEQKQITAHNN